MLNLSWASLDQIKLVVNCAPLPSQIDYNAKQDFYFQTFRVMIMAHDLSRETANSTFTLTIQNHRPALSRQHIQAQFKTYKKFIFVNKQFNFFVNQKTYMDEDGDPISYSVKQVPNRDLPSWLKFDEVNLQLYGKPTEAYLNKKVNLIFNITDGLFVTQESLQIHVVYSIEYILNQITFYLSLLLLLYSLYKLRVYFYNIFLKFLYIEKSKRVVRPGERYEKIIPLLLKLF